MRTVDLEIRLVPRTTASNFLTEIVDRKIVRVGNGQIAKLQLRDCFVLRVLARSIVYPALETSPYLISHEDLAPQNIIVDSDYNIKGIIDWGFARFLPLQFAVSFPRFLAIEPPQTDVTQSLDIISSISLQPSPVLQTDRQCFILYLSSKTTSLIQSISVVLSAPDVDWR